MNAHAPNQLLVTNKKQPYQTSPQFLVQGVRALLRLALPQRSIFIGGICALAVGSGINLLLPELVRRILDPGRFQWVTEHLPVMFGGLAALFLLQGAAFFVRSYLFGVVGQRVYADLREQMFRAVLSQDIGYFDTNRASDLAARINSDAALVQDAVSVKFSIIIRYGLQVVLGVILMLCMSWKLTAAIIVSVLLLVGVAILFASRLRVASREYQDALARFTSFASETFSGVKIIRVLGALDQLTRRAKVFNHEALTRGKRRILWGAGFSSGASALLNILLLCIAWYGVVLVMGGVLPLNELAAFVLYGAIVAVSFSFLISAYGDLMQSLGGLERVLQIINSEAQGSGEDKVDTPRFAQLEQRIVQSGDISVSGVWFSYSGRIDQPVLQGISCIISEGSFTAFVGSSGSGKSSLVQLLCGLYTPQRGKITISGEPLATLSQETLHTVLSWVPQEPMLFGFTVLDNILLGNSSLLRDEAKKILSGWDFLDFVETLEFGFDTPLGEHGTLLSGGQRQRLAIARALLRKPAILLLDEATSGLDSETEEQVLQTVREYLPQATVIVVSHRLSTVKGADKIYVLNEGCVVEEGTHAELTRASGLYSRYVERQTLA